MLGGRKSLELPLLFAISQPNEGLFFPSVFPPPLSGSWLIPHRITMVHCTSSSPLSLPCTKRNFLPRMHILRNHSLS